MWICIKLRMQLHVCNDTMKSDGENVMSWLQFSAPRFDRNIHYVSIKYISSGFS